MSSALDTLDAPRPSSVSQVTAVEQARAVAEVQAAVVVAQNVPRDLDNARRQMLEACGQRALADRAFWSLPRGRTKLVGPSVHLAREIARCFGNLQYGIAELRRDDAAGESEMQAWAWDVQNNTRAVRTVIVPHARMSGGKRQPLTDLGDITQNNTSWGARAVREVIFSILPEWYVEEAKQAAHATLQRGEDGVPFAKQVSNTIDGFAGLGVNTDDLERRIGRPKREWTAQDLATLRVVGASLSRGETTKADEFPTEPDRVTAAELTAATTTSSTEPREDDH